MIHLNDLVFVNADWGLTVGAFVTPPLSENVVFSYHDSAWAYVSDFPASLTPSCYLTGVAAPSTDQALAIGIEAAKIMIVGSSIFRFDEGDWTRNAYIKDAFFNAIRLESATSGWIVGFNVAEDIGPDTGRVWRWLNGEVEVMNLPAVSLPYWVAWDLAIVSPTPADWRR